MNGASVKLIVHGDDLGRSEPINLGIINAFQQGILSSTSIVAQGPAFEHALRIVRTTPGLDVGIHLCLDEYPPCSPETVRRFRARKGQFPTRTTTLLRLLRFRQLDVLAVENEWDAQIRKCLEAGIHPSHLDGHGHCHIHLALVPLVLKLTRKYEIPAVRVPSEPLGYYGTQGTPTRYVSKVMVKLFCLYARRIWSPHLRSPDNFFGYMAGGKLNVRELDFILPRLRAGVNELMVHVGMSDDDPFGLPYHWYADDFVTVTSQTKKQLLTTARVNVCSYRDAWN